jgi:hypothetical protein
MHKLFGLTTQEKNLYIRFMVSLGISFISILIVLVVVLIHQEKIKNQGKIVKGKITDTINSKGESVDHYRVVFLEESGEKIDRYISSSTNHSIGEVALLKYVPGDLESISFIEDEDSSIAGLILFSAVLITGMCCSGGWLFPDQLVSLLENSIL